MAIAEPRPERAVYDPTRDPDAVGSPPARRRYWISAAAGVVLLALVIAFFVYWL